MGIHIDLDFCFPVLYIDIVTIGFFSGGPFIGRARQENRQTGTGGS
jgi:hypothetical protein